MTLVHKITEVSSVKFYNTYSVYCIGRGLSKRVRGSDWHLTSVEKGLKRSKAEVDQ